MLQKGCECGEREMEEWKHSWDEIFMDEVRRERERRKRKEIEGRKQERGEKKRGEREKNQNVIKCLETEKDEKFNTLLQLSFSVLKVKNK
jgi:DNA-binding PadR family transcriptional regulator